MPKFVRRKLAKFTKRKAKRAKRMFRKKQKDFTTKVVTKVLGGFPERYFCKLRASGSGPLTVATSGYLAWRGNGIGNLSGPAVNGGTYASNYPSGLTYFIGNMADQPPVAPYYNYIVHASSLRVRLAPSDIGANNPSIINVALLPMNQDPRALGAQQWGIVSEQPRIKAKSISGNNTAHPLVIKNFRTTTRQLGFNLNYTGNSNLLGGYNTSPQDLWWWGLYVTGDGTNNLNASIEWEVTYYVEFLNRSSLFSTNAPV